VFSSKHVENGIHVIAQSEDICTQPIALYYGISYGHYALIRQEDPRKDDISKVK